MVEDRTGMVQVELSEDERNERARLQAAEQVKLDALLEKKRSHNREWNEQILQLEGTISQLAKEADDGQAWVPAQESMFSGGGSNDTDASEAEEPEAEPVKPKGRRRRARNGAALDTVDA